MLGAGARARSRRDGIATAAVDNPSVTTPGSDLHADGDNLRAALDAIDGPVVLVGHSYGGAVISDAGAHPNVEHLVYLTAFALDAGESVMQNDAHAAARTSKLARGDAVRRRHASTVDPARVVEFFYHDCTPEVAAAAAAQLRPMSMAAMAGACTRGGVAREALDVRRVHRRPRDPGRAAALVRGARRRRRRDADESLAVPEPTRTTSRGCSPDSRDALVASYAEPTMPASSVSDATRS